MRTIFYLHYNPIRGKPLPLNVFSRTGDSWIICWARWLKPSRVSLIFTRLFGAEVAFCCVICVFTCASWRGGKKLILLGKTWRLRGWWVWWTGLPRESSSRQGSELGIFQVTSHSPLLLNCSCHAGGSWFAALWGGTLTWEHLGGGKNKPAQYLDKPVAA